MNKKFFEGMKSFAILFLIAGIFCSAILIFSTLKTEVPAGASYSHTKTVFNPLGLVGVVACLFFSIAMYYILKSIALFGLKPYEDEADTTLPDNAYVQTNKQDVDKRLSGGETQANIVKNKVIFCVLLAVVSIVGLIIINIISSN